MACCVWRQVPNCRRIKRAIFWHETAGRIKECITPVKGNGTQHFRAQKAAAKQQKWGSSIYFMLPLEHAGMPILAWSQFKPGMPSGMLLSAWDHSLASLPKFPLPKFQQPLQLDTKSSKSSEPRFSVSRYRSANRTHLRKPFKIKETKTSPWASWCVAWCCTTVSMAFHLHLLLALDLQLASNLFLENRWFLAYFHDQI